MEGNKLKVRLVVMALLVVAMSLAVTAKLYDLQIINGDSYYRQSEKKITRTVKVDATGEKYWTAMGVSLCQTD